MLPRGSLCARVTGAEDREGIEQIVSAEGTAGWPECGVPAALPHADPLRPAHTPYLCLPALLPACALREPGVQAAPQQQGQGAQQEAHPRSHLAAAPAAERGRNAGLRGAGKPAGRQQGWGLCGCCGCAPPRTEGEGARGWPAPRLRALGRSSGTLRPEPEVVPLRRCLLSGLRAPRPKRQGRKGGREEGREPGTPTTPTHSAAGTRRF